MRVLLSTIGSRGEAQPMLALAVRLREFGHAAVVCAPPDFADRASALGVEYVPVGPTLRATARPGPEPTPEQRRALVDGTVAAQFEAVGAAAAGCEVVVGGGGLAIAARSIAESLAVPYVYVAFAPMTLPSPHHAPPVFGAAATDGDGDNATAWHRDRAMWNGVWRAPLNAARARRGLGEVDDVRDHLFTDRPWLAADPVLAPWPGGPDLTVFQPGAWLLDDTRPLDRGLEAFLDAGDPPVYLGFGSARAPEGLVRAAIEAARALGRRVVVSRGWADLRPVDDQPDCHSVGDVPHHALLPRVAAVIHHGGAGTTTAAARAGAAQVVVPQMFDQFYYARRVRELGLGETATRVSELGTALARALAPATVATARAVGARIVTDGADVAIARLLGTPKTVRADTRNSS
ncbi:glycosyltransferase [Nocardia asteroides]|uniref:glycosyltransferase n=1 Tax=Nocardia asteroides TaxID=1824 RepID=UPI001E4758AB|nr:glycosyltransferase [Nocardia asteroides]UGT56084.1 glycosyltransferase [Nocardia asteroides]